MSLKRYGLDELYNIAYETNRKGNKMKSNTALCIIIPIFFTILIIGLSYAHDKIECSQAAEAFNYKAKYFPYIGCVLTKPNGKKVLLKQLRDYGE